MKGYQCNIVLEESAISKRMATGEGVRIGYRKYPTKVWPLI